VQQAVRLLIGSREEKSTSKRRKIPRRRKVEAKAKKRSAGEGRKKKRL